MHTQFRAEYRQSYESGTPEERYFLNAELCATETLNNSETLGPNDRSRIVSLMNLVRLHHEKDREVMFLRESSKVDVEEKALILQYAKNATQRYVEDLLRRTKQDDYWVVAQGFCSDLSYLLQFHYFAKWIGSCACTPPSTCDVQFTARLQQLWNQSLLSEPRSVASSMAQELWKQSLVWAERRVGKATYFQLAPNMLTTSAVKQITQFDLSDDVAWNTLKSSRAACGPGTVVLEYFLSEKNDLQFVYVLTKVCSHRSLIANKKTCQSVRVVNNVARVGIKLKTMEIMGQNFFDIYSQGQYLKPFVFHQKANTYIYSL